MSNFLNAEQLQAENNRLCAENAELLRKEKSLVCEIEQHVRSEETLRASEERFRLLVDEVKEYSIFMLDPEGHIVSWNQGAVRTKGYKAEEIIGRSFTCFYTPEDQAKGKPAMLLRTAVNEGRAKDEGWRVRKDGSRFWADVVITAIHDHTGSLRGFAKITRDVTKRRIHEEEVRLLNESLKRQADDLRTSNQELEAFSYSVSHDLRTPLRAIDGFSRELLVNEEANLSESGKSDLQRIRAATQRMATLISALLELSRLSRSEPTIKELDISVLADTIIQELKAAEPERKVEWVRTPGLTANADSRLIFIVLDNLLSNAWKFTQKNPQAKIELGMNVQDGENVFFVRDNGVGFNLEKATKLFGAFQRLHDTKDFPGTGIGLALVQRIIRRHRGRIWAEAEENHGATFFFTLGAMV